MKTWTDYGFRDEYDYECFLNTYTFRALDEVRKNKILEIGKKLKSKKSKKFEIVNK